MPLELLMAALLAISSFFCGILYADWIQKKDLADKAKQGWPVACGKTDYYLINEEEYRNLLLIRALDSVSAHHANAQK